MPESEFPQEVVVALRDLQRSVGALESRLENMRGLLAEAVAEARLTNELLVRVIEEIRSQDYLP